MRIIISIFLLLACVLLNAQTNKNKQSIKAKSSTVKFDSTAYYKNQIPKVKIGEVVKMMDTSTMPLIVNFWASWCAPCIHEIPWFEKNVKEYAEKGVKLILVSLDFKEDYPLYLGSFVKKSGYSSQILWLNETDADVFCPKIDTAWSGAIPATVMVNNAKKYKAFYGGQLTEPKFIEALKNLVQ